MSVITVDLADRPYEIHIEAGLLQNIATYLAPFARAGRFLVVSDENVAKHIWPGFHRQLSDANLAAEIFVLPAGEAGKSWLELEKLTDWLLEHHVERSDHIIALGGGVVGDITGFAAHIVKRGCSFIQIPTTLLAQVDSSVGGKTAINSRAGKNLVGAFHQPSVVLIDPEVLESLPRRQLAAGFAEVVKYGLIDDLEFFDWCETSLDAFFAGDASARQHAIEHSVKAKARIVAADERELNGTRALLNLGHTFGHALEADTGFSDRLFHGEAVAAGMVLAFRYSSKIGLCSADDANRAAQLLHNAGLPVTLADAGVSAHGAKLVDYMMHDKKMAGGKLPFLLAHGIGKTFLSKDVDLADVAAFLDSQLPAGLTA
ncbi:3-dehydroquinate synthase [Sphingorhabdus sp. IMCC26285]|jgi:3-dehydroquinate synthase|uniref:3-dehydroquinate synthase n=1 Tax=Sphingorhabdus profundilacus TaxID=2509718 RepID=A0A6I4M5I8_9SPHN|nr:3-dehydroquinate synthase [Sphingorhabdus profundilacus]MVZ97495.1 3-dehydroquinate synthase [Sphingorhabdus profundilacus]